MNHGIVAHAMRDALTTAVSELPDSRVRVNVEVEPDEIEGRIERQARELAPRLKLAGFRRGKVPAPLVIQRMGREAVFEEAVRSSLGGWYASAIESAGIVPVGDPSVQLGDAPGQGEPFQFSIEVGVLPKATLGKYKGLEVPRREPAVPEEAIEEEIEGLRERLARLEDVDGQAQRGDFVVIDYGAQLDGETQAVAEERDQLVELERGNLLPSLEAGLLGASAGEERTIDGTFPEHYPNPKLAGHTASFAVKVKQVKRKALPELDEDFAADTGFDSIAELREDIARRLRAADERRVESEFREAALDEATQQARVTVPPELSEARAREMWERTLRALARQGISRESYLKITSRSEDELLRELAPAAEQALRREAVLTAVVDAEGISPDDSELVELLREVTGNDEGSEGEEGSERDEGSERGADRGGEHERADQREQRRGRPQAGAADERRGERMLEELRRSGRLEELREELAARKAVDLIAAEAEPIAGERALARAKLWTPEKEAAEIAAGSRAPGAPTAPAPGAPEQRQGGQRLWTPRSSG
jgi:trigger factor